MRREDEGAPGREDGQTCKRHLRALACSHLAGGLQDLGAERHDGTQHRQEPEDKEDP